ncbi:MAG TPA: DinB family protein [Acidimicrobiales bacterium]|nr:DinB family protein [Acidimicrobiales bacterium]
MTNTTSDRERHDTLDVLRKHRQLLLGTVQGVTDEQAAARTTVSELCLGGIIKHVSQVEERWAGFIVDGPSVFPPMDEAAYKAHLESFQMQPDETLAGIVAAYDAVARRVDDLVMSVPSFDDDHELPPAPWFEPGARWSARRVFAHIVAETAQHAGHADIIREAIDGQKSMG